MAGSPVESPAGGQYDPKKGHQDKGPALGEASASPADDSNPVWSVYRVYAYATLPLPRALVFLILLTLLAGLVLVLLLLAGLLAAALLLLTGLSILLIRVLVLVLLLHTADSLPVERRINVHRADWLPERPVPPGQGYGKVGTKEGRPEPSAVAVESGI
jgi:hypothetical protein